MMITQTAAVLELPSDSTCLKMTLRPEVQRLRDAALRLQRSELLRIPTLPLIDAASWAEHTAEEDWLIWRARRVAERLRQMPLELSPGERIVGRPDLRPRTAREVRAIEDAKAMLQTIPPYPGGDAGHFHPDFDKLFRVGIAGLRSEITEREEQASEEQRTFYRACQIAIEGMSDYAKRVADACEHAAGQEPDGAQWHDLARVCRNISSAPPATFHEAIELLFLTIIALWFGEDHGLTAPGRLDQTLRPFYEADLAAGRIDREEAFELICLLYIQLNMILGAGSALSVLVGGRDRNGKDATCGLTYLCLAARLATQLVYPTVALAWHEGTPSELTDFCCRMLATGIGDPAFFNDELISGGLRDHGVSERDAYNYMNSTCVEIKVVGSSNMWVTAPYFNCPKGLLDVMEKIATGAIPEPATFAQFNDRVRHQLATEVEKSAQQLDKIWYQRAVTGCFPLASCFIDDCLAKGMDFDRGGARYNWVENSFVGLANLVDGLIAVKRLVYDTQEITIREFREMLRNDYQGQEPLRLRILNRLPSYGNGDEEVDALAVEWAENLQETTESNVVGLHNYVPGFFCWVMHERFGANTGATPDGRKAGTALADGAGAAQGREKEGPTTSVLSTTKWNHRRALGGLVHNVKFSKATLRTEQDLTALRSLIEIYLRRGGFEIQVNVVNADILRDAQANPENYADLLVRIAGYSDYFVHLDPNMQAEVIERTEHTFG